DARAVGRAGGGDDGDPTTGQECARPLEHRRTVSEGRSQRAEVVDDAHRLFPSAFCLLPSALKSVKRICKPNSVLPERSEDHSSATRVAAVVEQPTRKLNDGNGRFHRFPIWSCSAGGLPCRRRSRGTRCALTA